MSKNEFSWKKGLCQFLDIPIIYHRAKNQKKTNDPFLKKNAELTDKQTERQTDGQTDRQTDNSDFIGPSVGQGPKM